MMSIVNLSGYLFLPLENLIQLRMKIREALSALPQLKGTILLAPEGINAFLAGAETSVKAAEALIAQHIGQPVAFKRSYSDHIPFNRLLVKIKKEIIAFGIPEASPLTQPAPYLSPETLKKWLDEGRDDTGREVILLDTRNDYEYDIGTFTTAIVLPIRTFRDFPDLVDTFPDDWRNKTIVSFCTGGIRCEKAAPLLCMKGYRAYQLDGGILKYFEVCGDAHWQGECFVFDHRVALDPALKETGTSQCFACRMPLKPEEQQGHDYAYGQHCHWCRDN